jgi:hypothetical protein
LVTVSRSIYTSPKAPFPSTSPILRFLFFFWIDSSIRIRNSEESKVEIGSLLLLDPVVFFGTEVVSLDFDEVSASTLAYNFFHFTNDSTGVSG